MTRLFAALLILGCGGTPVVWPEAPGPFVIPLIENHGIARLLVEVRINGQGPYLMELDTELDGWTVVPEMATTLKLRVSATGRGPRMAAVSQLDLGALSLRTLSARLDPTRLAPWQGRSIAGRLGSLLYRNAVLDIDRNRGALVIHRQPPPTPTDGWQSSAETDGPLELPARINDLPIDTLRLTTRQPFSVIDLKTAKALTETPNLSDQKQFPRLAIGDRPFGRPKFGIMDIKGADAWLGRDSLVGLNVRIDGINGRLSLWKATTTEFLRRFPRSLIVARVSSAAVLDSPPSPSPTRPTSTSPDRKSTCPPPTGCVSPSAPAPP